MSGMSGMASATPVAPVTLASAPVTRASASAAPAAGSGTAPRPAPGGPPPPRSRAARRKTTAFLLGLALLVIASFASLDLQWAQFLSLEALRSMGRFLAEFFPPD